VPDYTLITMPFPPRYFHRDFLKINVLGTIPFLKDGDNAMTESCASEFGQLALNQLNEIRSYLYIALVGIISIAVYC
jgi:hypothetical protein